MNKIEIGNFRLIESVQIIVREGEMVLMTPFNGLFNLEIIFTETEDEKDRARWSLKTKNENTLNLNLINHHATPLGGTSIDDIPLGTTQDKRFLFRYAYRPFGDNPSNKTMTLTCVFGESNV